MHLRPQCVERSLRASPSAGPLTLCQGGRTWRLRVFTHVGGDISAPRPGHRQNRGSRICGLLPSLQFIGELLLFLHGNYLPLATCEGEKKTH